MASMSGFDPATISLGKQAQVSLNDPNAQMIVAQSETAPSFGAKKHTNETGAPKIRCTNTTDRRGSNNRGCTNTNEC